MTSEQYAQPGVECRDSQANWEQIVEMFQTVSATGADTQCELETVEQGYDAPGNDEIAARREHGIEATAFVVPRYGQVFRY